MGSRNQCGRDLEDNRFTLEVRAWERVSGAGPWWVTTHTETFTLPDAENLRPPVRRFWQEGDGQDIIQDLI
jgi:hypothetical protein